MAHLCTSLGGAVTSPRRGRGSLFWARFLGRAGARCGLVAGVGDLGAVHPGVCVVEHDVVADRDPVLRGVTGKGAVCGQQTRLVQQVGEQGTEFVKERCAEGVEKVPQARGRRGFSLLEAKEPSPSSAVLTGQQLGQRAPAEVQFATQADAQEERDRVEGRLPFGALGIVAVGQVGAQGGKVDQAQDHLEGCQMSKRGALE
ncbi:hypothetical protein DRJ17_07505 [Candidatus Woesearchaeota archaeon]|nr:MAG: hypothetical protein DRJ17_07505 [Candidatus Woesearchaeota archaeon]